MKTMLAAGWARLRKYAVGKGDFFNEECPTCEHPRSKVIAVYDCFMQVRCMNPSCQNVQALERPTVLPS